MTTLRLVYGLANVDRTSGSGVATTVGVVGGIGGSS